MNALRYLAPLAIVGALVVACSDDEVASSSSSSGSSGASSGVGSSGRPSKGNSTSGWSGGTSGWYGGTSGYGSTSGYSSSSSGWTDIGMPIYLDVGEILSIKASKSTCGGAPGQCYDAQAITVDLVGQKVTNTTCIELASTDDAGVGTTKNVDTTHVLTAEQVTDVQGLLKGIVAVGDKVSGYDGPQWILEVTTKNGTRLYAQTSGCGPQEQMLPIKSGWNELWDGISGL